MFRNTSLAATAGALTWDLNNNCVSMASMFEFSNFSQPVAFINTLGLRDMSRMFYGASFNQNVSFDTRSVTSMESMFARTTAFNQTVSLGADSLLNANAMFEFSAMNSPVTLTNSFSLRSTARMFGNARRFNQLVTLQTGNVTNMTGMFASASAFNQPLNLDTGNVTTMLNFLNGATNFNQDVNFDTSQVTTMDSMFKGAVRFNRPVLFNTANVYCMCEMFRDCHSLNSQVHFSPTNSLRLLDYTFQDCHSFNQFLNFSTRTVEAMISLFENATDFNQSLAHWDVRRVTTMQRMFYDAKSFNQPLFSNTSSVADMTSMFEGATNFNQPINFQSPSLRDTTDMFRGAAKFNQPLNLQIAQVTTMDGMFKGANSFQQNLSGWNASTVSSCLEFCDYCGLPSFPLCMPCTDAARFTSLKNNSVCSCPPGEFVITASQCGVDFCALTQADPGLQVDCVASTPKPTPAPGSPTPVFTIISPILNITRNDTNATTFVFTLPIFPQALAQLGRVVPQPCSGQQMTCEWQDPHTAEFLQSGCVVSATNVDLGSGIMGTQCTCEHLTVFAIVLRDEMQLAPLCQAEQVDYVLIALYGVLGVFLSIQIARLFFHRVIRISLAQHSLLLLACLLRVAFLIAKPVIDSLPGLVMLGLLPSAISLSLFIYLLLTWASLQLFAMKVSPFAKLRVPFVLVTICVFLLIVAIVVAVAVTDGDGQTHIDIVTDGSYVLAALYFVVCLLVLISGLGLTRILSPGASRDSNDWRSAFRCRAFSATIGLSLALFVGACLWVAAVQAEILGSSVGTLATITAFYVCDWLSLVVITWLFAMGVSGAVRKAKGSSASNKTTADASRSHDPL